jgi:hypothetical protein
MISNAIHQVANMVGALEQPAERDWTTRMTQHDVPVVGEDILCGFCCTPCAMAIAMEKQEKQNALHNLLCWVVSPPAALSWFRVNYNIKGECGEDICYSLICPCCSAKQMYTEARLHGPLQGVIGTNSHNWQTGIFACGCMEICYALFCPCCMVNPLRLILQGKSQSYCFDCFCIPPCALYGAVRNRYGLISDCACIEDTFLPLICFPCALARADREARWQVANGYRAGLVRTTQNLQQAVTNTVQRVQPGYAATQPPQGQPAYAQPAYAQPAYGAPQRM